MKDDKKLNVLFVHTDPCVRAEKEAYALKQCGHSVHLMCEGINFQPNMKNIASSVSYYSGLDELGELLRKHDGFDVVHCHNEPNEPTVVALDNVQCPVVYDCHDYRGLRQKLEGQEALTEKRCFEDTHAVIHVSEGMLAAAAERYSSKFAMVLPSYPLIQESVHIGGQKLPGIHVAYVGGLRDKGSGFYEYRNYYPFFQALVEAGIHVHAYPADMNPKNLSTYMELDSSSEFFHLHEKCPYDVLIKEVSQYQWGLSGFNFNDIQDESTISFLNNALPNKLFDYIIAGVCPVVINNATSAQYVESQKIGFKASNIKELVDIISNETPIPPLSDLSTIDMLEQVTHLEKLYYNLLES